MQPIDQHISALSGQATNAALRAIDRGDIPHARRMTGLFNFLGDELARVMREGSSPKGGNPVGGSMRSTPSPTPKGARPC